MQLPALFLVPDAVDMNTAKLMGRQSAGNGFLRGFVQHFEATQTLPIVGFNKSTETAITGLLRDMGWRGPLAHFVASQPQQWVGFDLLYYPAPMGNQLAWQRMRRGINAYALCGVTHTISSSGAMRQIADYMREPFAPWDALICTTPSVLRAVERIWEAEADYLAWRFGTPALASAATKPIMTPVIPLGVHCADYQAQAGTRDAVRQTWGVTEDDVVVLFVGRLSLHAKANPLPMYVACQRAALQSGKRVRIVECGWFISDAMRDAFAQAAAQANVEVTFMDGRVSGAAKQAYAGADMFVSLSDNIQETFGLTPVEAMAAGLPVVASDWDGYRDTIRHNVDGFLVPTCQPGHMADGDTLAHAYADEQISYDKYLAFSHVSVAVDVEATAQAIAQLAANPELRQRMGASGRERAAQVFDWRVVMAQYDELWRTQGELRRAGQQHRLAQRTPAGKPQPSNARALNPLDLFAHYASFAIQPHTQVSLSVPLQGKPTDEVNAHIAAMRGLGMWAMANGWLAGADKLQQLVAPLVPAAQPGQDQNQEVSLSVEQLGCAAGFSQASAQRALAWLAKVGLLRLQ